MTIWAAVATHNIATVAIASLIGSTLGACALLCILLKQCPVRPSFHAKEARVIVGYGISLMGLNIPGVIANTVDRTVVVIVLGPASVTLVEIAAQVVAAISAVQSVVTGTLSAAAAHVGARGGKVALAELFERGTRYILAITYPLAIMFVALAAPILHIWVGPTFHAAIPVIAAAMFALTVDTLGSPASFILMGIGRAKATIPYYAIGTAVNIGMTLLLVHLVGVAGAPLATGIGAAIYTVPIVLIALSELNLTAKTFIGRSIRPIALPAAGLTVILVVVHLIPFKSTEPIVVLSTMAGVAYFLLVAMTKAMRGELREITRAIHKSTNG